MVVVDSIVNHGHMHTLAQVSGRMSGGHIGVLALRPAAMAPIVQMPLTARQFVGDSFWPGLCPALRQQRRVLCVDTQCQVIVGPPVVGVLGGFDLHIAVPAPGRHI